MKPISVKDLVVPLDEYAKVSEEATLYDAVRALQESQKRFAGSIYPHRAVLVQDGSGRVVGKISMLNVLRGLEPKYEEIEGAKDMARATSRYAYFPEFMKFLREKYGLWQKPLEDLSGKASRIKVKDIMHIPGEGEYVKEDATLDEAIHQFIMGQSQSLLVTRGSQIVGVLRLSDVFHEVCEMVRKKQP